MDHAWNQRFDVGDAALDHDHHTQIALLSSFVDALEQGRPALATRLGEQLRDYSRAHFRSEELLMESKGYGERATHASEHDGLIARIAEVNEAHAAGNVELAISLALDFRTELAGHMNGADRRVAEYTQGRAHEAR